MGHTMLNNGSVGKKNARWIGFLAVLNIMERYLDFGRCQPPSEEDDSEVYLPMRTRRRVTRQMTFQGCGRWIFVPTQYTSCSVDYFHSRISLHKTKDQPIIKLPRYRLVFLYISHWFFSSKPNTTENRLI
jgi:hypothetical protein